MEVLIISTNAIGDTYLSAAAIDALKKELGDVAVDFVIAKPSQILLEGLPVREAFVLQRGDAASFFRMQARLGRYQYHIAFSFIPGMLNSAILLRARARIKSGFLKLSPSPEWHNRSHTLHVTGGRAGRQRWLPDMKYLQLVNIALGGAGISGTTVPKPIIQSRGPAKHSHNGAIVVHHKSRIHTKSLNDAALTFLIRHIAEELRSSVVLIGSHWG